MQKAQIAQEMAQHHKEPVRSGAEAHPGYVGSNLFVMVLIAEIS